jgi:hypothetical protein
LLAIAIFELAAALRQHPELLGAERANQSMPVKTVRMSFGSGLHWLTPIWFLCSNAMRTNFIRAGNKNGERDTHVPSGVRTCHDATVALVIDYYVIDYA